MTQQSNGSTFKYREFNLHGWKILVDYALWSDEKATTLYALGMIEKQLQDLSDTLPGKAVARLLSVPIYVSNNKDLGKVAVFNSRPDSLLRPNDDRNKLNSIEILHPELFIRASVFDSGIILHEMSHAWNFLFMHPDDKMTLAMHYLEILDSETIYFSVKRGSEQTRAYALTSVYEYFAETSEAFWGLNDYFPHTREELRQYDFGGYELIDRAWRR